MFHRSISFIEMIVANQTASLMAAEKSLIVFGHRIDGKERNKIKK